MAFYVYIVRCRDESLYTGWTTDVRERVRKHGEGRGAKYTRSRRPVALVYCERALTAQEAQRREREIKRLSRTEKLALVGAAEPLRQFMEGGNGMYPHHIQSIAKLKDYFYGQDGVIAAVLDGSVVKGNERPDSDIDALVVVTEERYRALAAENRLAEVIRGYCTYAGGYFDVKYKTKALLQEAALRASEPTRSAYVKAQVLFSSDEEIAPLIEAIARYPEGEREEKVACFNANLELNRGYFLHCVPEDNAYMRAHLADEIVYSVYRLILAENRVLFPCNRRLEEAVRSCAHRPENILALGAAFLKEITPERCEAFVGAFLAQTQLSLTQDVSENCSRYVRFYEDWWREEHPPFPNEW